MELIVDTSRIEALLEQLLNKQDELISRIESLETTIEQQLSEANSSISYLKDSTSSINDELNWWGGEHSLAKQLFSRLDAIEVAASGR